MLLALLLASSITVIDGDTIRRGEETIRILNIDTPEIRDAKYDAERMLGLVARMRLGQLLASGTVTITPNKGRPYDRYGRLLATVSVNGRDVGDVLVAEHLARPWTGKRRPWCVTP